MVLLHRVLYGQNEPENEGCYCDDEQQQHLVGTKRKTEFTLMANNRLTAGSTGATLIWLLFDERPARGRVAVLLLLQSLLLLLLDGNTDILSGCRCRDLLLSCIHSLHRTANSQLYARSLRRRPRAGARRPSD